MSKHTAIQPQKTAAPTRTPIPGGLLQRACACGQHTGGGACAACREKREGTLQRAAVQSSSVSAAPSIVHDALRSPGQPLDTATRAFMEPRFGQDFSQVRVHSDARATESAQAVNALAYTVGRDVVFGAGQYQPQTTEGRRLMAHELTHVVQQRAGVLQGKLYLDTEANNSLELEAERAEHTIESAFLTVEPSTSFAQAPATLIQRRVRRENVTCRATGLTNPDLTGDEVIAVLQAADSEAIELAQGAETALAGNLSAARAGDSVDAEFDTILQEELGLTLTNKAHFQLIQQQISRFRRVRETLESGYLIYMCRGSTVSPISLVGCQPAPCGDEFASSCPGNRLIVLCQAFWDNPDERSATILHEPFHIWFEMARHAPNALRRADASCFESFALRVAGQTAFASCADHTAG